MSTRNGLARGLHNRTLYCGGVAVTARVEAERLAVTFAIVGVGMGFVCLCAAAVVECVEKIPVVVILTPVRDDDVEGRFDAGVDGVPATSRLLAANQVAVESLAVIFGGWGGIC